MQEGLTGKNPLRLRLSIYKLMHSFAYQLWFVSGCMSRLSISCVCSWCWQSCFAIQQGHALWSWMSSILLVFTWELQQGVREEFGHWAVALGTKIPESPTQYCSSWKGPAPPRAVPVSAARQVLGTLLGAEQVESIPSGWQGATPPLQGDEKVPIAFSVAQRVSSPVLFPLLQAALLLLIFAM